MRERGGYGRSGSTRGSGRWGNKESEQVDFRDSAGNFTICSILMIKSKMSEGCRNAGRNGSIGTGGSQLHLLEPGSSSGIVRISQGNQESIPWSRARIRVEPLCLHFATAAIG